MKPWKRVKSNKPKRSQLLGMSPSRFKTKLKLLGHKVPRDFFKRGSVSEFKGRYWRWRWWSEVPEVDISCTKSDFDRWANSVDKVDDFTFNLLIVYNV